MTTPTPTIDSILSAFFRERRKGVSGPRHGDITRVETSLRDFAEFFGPSRLCAHHQSVLGRERRAGRRNPVAHLLRADALLDILAAFVALSVPVEEQRRRLQLQLVAALLSSLLERRLVDGADVAYLFQLRRQVRRMEAGLPARRETQP
ncbi:hypothetical protein [Naasia aerilata]|nr:hypothetical protein [Naasia aerilata]